MNPPAISADRFLVEPSLMRTLVERVCVPDEAGAALVRLGCFTSEPGVCAHTVKCLGTWRYGADAVGDKLADRLVDKVRAILAALPAYIPPLVWLSVTPSAVRTHAGEVDLALEFSLQHAGAGKTQCSVAGIVVEPARARRALTGVPQ